MGDGRLNIVNSDVGNGTMQSLGETIEPKLIPSKVKTYVAALIEIWIFTEDFAPPRL